jgi:hypothetical protein
VKFEDQALQNQPLAIGFLAFGSWLLAFGLTLLLGMVFSERLPITAITLRSRAITAIADAIQDFAGESQPVQSSKAGSGAFACSL